MKLCITAAGNDLSALADSAFGRAPWFVLVDTDSAEAQAIANTSINASNGAGIAAAQTMSDNGVDAVLTGRLGPKAKAALAAADIGMYEGLGRVTVGEALEQFRSGKYTLSGSITGSTGGAASGVAAVSPAVAGQPASQPSGEAGACRGNGIGRGRGGGGGGQEKGRNCGCGNGSGGGRGQGGRGRR